MTAGVKPRRSEEQWETEPVPRDGGGGVRRTEKFAAQSDSGWNDHAWHSRESGMIGSAGRQHSRRRIDDGGRREREQGLGGSQGRGG